MDDSKKPILFIAVFIILSLIGGGISYSINDKLNIRDPKKTSNGKAFGIGFGITAAVVIIINLIKMILKKHLTVKHFGLDLNIL